MSDSNTGLLVGILVVACVLLLMCKKSCKTEPMRRRLGVLPNVPGVRLEGYTSMPRHGTFSDRREGLNCMETMATPASNAVKQPDDAVISQHWATDASIQLNPQNGGTDLTAQAGEDLIAQLLARSSNSLPGNTTGMDFVEYGSNMHATRWLST